MRILIFILLNIFIFELNASTVHPDSLITGKDNLISEESLASHVNILGSDLYEGRAMGTTGGNQAAKYLETQFQNLGLIPLGDEGTFYQYIPMHASRPLSQSELNVTGGNNKNINLILNSDYLLYKAGEQTFIPNPLPLVFVGYGIIAPEFDYNDYQSVDVEGKIVVFLDGEPFSKDEKYFNGSNPSIYSLPESKQRIAISRGASGSILVPMIDSNQKEQWNKLVKEFSFEDVTLAYSVAGNLSLLINPSTAGLLFESARYTLHEVYRMQKQNILRSFPLETKISFNGVFKERDFTSANIIGMIKGTDLDISDTYVLISAHYDHLGIGPAVNGDSIYNGVYDNAIGVAALLEIASAFKKINPQPKRSIIFLLTAGEEKGWLGSTYYISKPVVPLYKTIVNVNVDGIALFDKFKSIVGVGKEYSTLYEHLIRVATENQLKVENIPEQFVQSESFTRSDQVIFAQAGIPSILISEGLDYENLSREEGINLFIRYSEKVYHTPFDDLNQLMNFGAAKQHTKIIFDFCYSLSNSDEEPEWKESSPFINARLRSRAERK